MFEHCLIATGFGPVGLAWSADGLIRLQLPDVDAATTRALLLRGIDASEAHPPSWLAPSVRKLQSYFSGGPTELVDTPLDLAVVPDFPRRLYEELLTLSWGESITYGDLAARIGAHGAAQAVGRAMGRNPIPVIIPCHRILASGNRLGGFSAPGGRHTKLRLLELEGIELGVRDADQMGFAF